VTGQWRKLHDELVCSMMKSLYVVLLNIMKVIKSWMMGWMDGTQSVQGRGEMCIKNLILSSCGDNIKMYSSGYSAYEPTARSCQHGNRNIDTDDKM
jgi:hypothetical protein